MQRYWRIYRTFFLSSLARELEFRANFFAKVAQNFVWICFFVLVLLVIYRNTPDVAGWSRGEAFVLAATCFLMNAVSSALFMSLMEIPEHVRKGTLDFVLTKPVDTQFWISTRKFGFEQIGTLAAGLIMVVYGLYSAQISPSVAQWLAYAVLVAASIVIFYAFNLMLMTTGIWLIRVDNLWVLGESVMQIARYPLDIYTRNLQRVFIFAVPLAFIATIPSRQLTEAVSWPLVGLGLLWAAAFFIAARVFWNFALTHYGSASS